MKKNSPEILCVCKDDDAALNEKRQVRNALLSCPHRSWIEAHRHFHCACPHAYLGYIESKPKNEAEPSTSIFDHWIFDAVRNAADFEYSRFCPPMDLKRRLAKKPSKLVIENTK